MAGTKITEIHGTHSEPFQMTIKMTNSFYTGYAKKRARQLVKKAQKTHAMKVHRSTADEIHVKPVNKILLHHTYQKSKAQNKSGDVLGKNFSQKLTIAQPRMNGNPSIMESRFGSCTILTINIPQNQKTMLKRQYELIMAKDGSERDLRKEYDVVKNLSAGSDGTNLIRMLGFFQPTFLPSTCALLYETSQSTLSKIIAKKVEMGYPPFHILIVAKTLAALSSAISDLHGKNLIHGNLDDKSVFVFGNFDRICIGDYSKVKEVDRSNEIDAKTRDIFRIGAVVRAMINFEDVVLEDSLPPRGPLEEMDHYLNTSSIDIDAITGKKAECIDVYEFVLFLLRQCFKKCRRVRPRAHNLLCASQKIVKYLSSPHTQ